LKEEYFALRLINKKNGGLIPEAEEGGSRDWKLQEADGTSPLGDKENRKGKNNPSSIWGSSSVNRANFALHTIIVRRWIGF